MGWVVRNALSHNGKVLFKNMKSDPVKWDEIVVSPANQHEPISNVINFTEMLLLLLDMEEVLDK
jgi:hypothetical protein